LVSIGLDCEKKVVLFPHSISAPLTSDTVSPYKTALENKYLSKNKYVLQ
jgi:hypothetical protein